MINNSIPENFQIVSNNKFQNFIKDVFAKKIIIWLKIF